MSLVSARREKAMAIHNTQKETVENTVNPTLQKSVISRSQTRINSATIKKVNQLKGKNHDNKKQIIQAIERTCLPGPINKADCKVATDAIKDLPKENHHLVLLFRNEKFQYRAIYVLHKNEDQNDNTDSVVLKKLSGKGPAQLVTENVRFYYSYTDFSINIF